MLDVVKRVYSNYAIFSGRESRRDFWLFQPFLVLVSAETTILNVAILSVGIASSSWLILSAILTGFNVVVALFGLATIIPSIAQHARRFHDANLSAWWLLISLVPVIGVLAVYGMALIPSFAGTSRYENEGSSSNNNFGSQQQFATSMPGPDVW